MPVAQVEGVPALIGIAGPVAEVGEVACRGVGLVLVVAGAGVSPLAMASPRRVVAVREVPGGSVGICVVTQGQDGALQVIEQRRGGLIGDQSQLAMSPAAKTTGSCGDSDGWVSSLDAGAGQGRTPPERPLECTPR